MKVHIKFLKAFGVLLVAALLFAALPASEVKAQATLCVNTTGDGGCYTSIQAAIDAANAGGTVNVAAGTYVELLSINKPLTLLGPNADIDGRSETRNDEAIITYPDEDNSLLSLIDAKSNGIAVKGFTFTNNQIDNHGVSGGWDVILVGEDITFINNRVISQAQRKIPFKIQGPFNGAGDPNNNYGGAVVKNNYFSGPNTSWNPVVMQGIGATVQDNLVEGGAVGIQIQPYTNTVGGIVSGNEISAYMISIWHNYHTGGNGLWIYENNYLTTSVPLTTAFRYGYQADWRGIRLETHRPNVEIRNNVFDDGDNDDYWVGDDWFERTSVGILYWANLEADSHIDVHDNEFINVEKNVENQAPATGNLNGVFENNTFAKSVYIENGFIIYTSIQEAIDDASDGDTILVGPGTYIEDISVTGKNFNLIGTVDGEGNPISIIQGSLNINNNGITTELTTTIENIYFDGVSKHLLTLREFNGGLIKNCVFDGNGRFMGSGAEEPFNGIQLTNPNESITVEDSTFKDGLYVSINGYFTGLTVKDSTFTNVKSGINLINGGNLAITNSYFKNKPVTDTDSYGIRYTAGGGKSLSVTNSTFEIDLSEGLKPKVGEYHTSIYLRGSGADTVDITGNKIYGGAVNTSSISALNVSPNWWGSQCGPSNITGNVVYAPWYADEAMTTTTDAEPVSGEYTFPSGTSHDEINAVVACAAPGSTLIFDGEYQASIWVHEDRKDLTFLLKDGTVLKGYEEKGYCFYVDGNYITIKSETIGGAKCVPTGNIIPAFPAFEIGNAGPVTDFVLKGIEIDGTEGNNGFGIAIGTGVQNVLIVDNYIHDLKEGAMVLWGDVGGVFDVQGNLFQNIGPISHANFDYGRDIYDLKFNSWGSYNVEGSQVFSDDVGSGVEFLFEPWTHVEVYLESTNPKVDNWPNQVFVGEEITYEVKADLRQVMGASFELEFPANLEVVGDPVKGEIFDVGMLAVDKTNYRIKFDGYQAGEVGAPAEAVDGKGETLFTVTFKANTVGKGLDLKFDETTDLFAMSPGYGPSTHIYANELRGVKLDVIDRPTLAITGLEDPFYVGVMSHEITNTLCNPETGGDWSESPGEPDAIGWIRISDVNLGDIASLQFWYDNDWHDFSVQDQYGGIAVFQDENDVVARFGNYNFGFDIPLQAGGWCDIDRFQVKFTKPGTHQVTVSIYDMMDTHDDYTDDILLVSSGPTEITVVDSGIEVTGTISMQGRTDRSGVPVTLISALYEDITAYSTNRISNNLRFMLNGGEFTFTTLQPRYLNVTADLEKTLTVEGAGTIAALELKGGNAYWRLLDEDGNVAVDADGNVTYDNKIDILDATQVGNDYGKTGVEHDGDVNFDGKINIFDLALVGGNFDLTSGKAYGDWTP
jgi:hypothetical protein